MSRRFGRNQRRRAREQAAALTLENLALSEKASKFEAAHRLESELVRFQSRRIDELQKILQRVRACLPRNHASLPPETRADQNLDPRRPHRLELRHTGLYRNLGGPMDPVMEAYDTVRAVEAYAVLMSKREIPYSDPFCRMLHFRAEFDGLETAYRITADAMKNMPIDELIEMLSGEMARHLVDLVRGGRG